MGLCKNRTWMMVTFIWSIDASVYYAFAIIWPDMVNVLYANGRHMWAGWASCVVTGGITVGMVGAGIVKKKVHWILRICFFIGSSLLAGKICSRWIEPATISIDANLCQISHGLMYSRHRDESYCPSSPWMYFCWFC